MHVIQSFPLFFCLLLFTGAGGSHAQNWRFGFQLYPNISDGLPGNGTNAAYFKGTETTVFSWSAGARARYKISDHRSLCTGLLFQQTGDRSTDFPADTAIYLNGPYHIRSYIRYIEIPLTFQEIFNDKWFYGAGISASIAFRFRNTLYYPGPVDDEYDLDVRASVINIFLNAEAGYLQPIGKRTCSVALYAQYGLRPGFRSSEGYFSHHPQLPARHYLSLGINFGFLF